MDEFKKSLTPKEKLVLEIAADHLKTSFSMKKCIAFEKFMAEKN